MKLSECHQFSGDLLICRYPYIKSHFIQYNHRPPIPCGPSPFLAKRIMDKDLPYKHKQAAIQNMLKLNKVLSSVADP